MYSIRCNGADKRFVATRLTLHHCTLRYDEVPQGEPVGLAALVPRLTALILHDMTVDDRLLASMLQGCGARLTFLSLQNVTLHNTDGHARTTLERCLGAEETYGRLETLVVAGVEVRGAHAGCTAPLQMGFVGRMPRLATLALDVRATIPPRGHARPWAVAPMPELRTLVLGNDVDAVWRHLPAWCPGLQSLISASASANTREALQCLTALPQLAIVSPGICAVSDVRATADGLTGVLEGTSPEHARLHPEPDTLVHEWAHVKPRPQQLYVSASVMGGEQLQRALALVDASSIREVDLSGSATMADRDAARALLSALPQGLAKLTLNVDVGQHALKALATDDQLLGSLRTIGIEGWWPKPRTNARDIARLAVQRLHPRGELLRIEVYAAEDAMSATAFERLLKQAHDERGIPMPPVQMNRQVGTVNASWRCGIYAAPKPDPDSAA